MAADDAGAGDAATSAEPAAEAAAAATAALAAAAMAEATTFIDGFEAGGLPRAESTEHARTDTTGNAADSAAATSSAAAAPWLGGILLAMA